MNHIDYLNLLRPGILASGGIWADLGSGTGAFTMALAELMGQNGVIYSVDQDSRALAEQQRQMKTHFPQTQVHYLAADFAKPLDVPKLDGIVMANSLHFISPKQKAGVIQHIKQLLKPEGCLIIVEYNVDHGNVWVPYPFSYSSWEKLARQAGFDHTRLLAAHPSRFLKEFYSAKSW